MVVSLSLGSLADALSLSLLLVMFCYKRFRKSTQMALPQEAVSFHMEIVTFFHFIVRYYVMN